MAVAPEALEQILAGITNPSGTGIQKASQALQKSLRQPQCLVPLLVVAQQSRDEAVRQLACVTMRRKVAPYWKRVSAQEQAQLRTTLLTVLHAEQAPQVKKSIIDLTAEVARVSVKGGNDWQELLPFLQKYVQSSNDFDVEYALRLFATLLQTATIGPQLAGFFDELTRMFAAGLKHENSSIRSEALHAFLGLVSVADADQAVEDGATPTSPQLEKLQEVIPLAINSLEKSVHEGNVKETERAMEFFSSFILECVALKDQIADKLMRFMLFVIENQNLSLKIRGQSVFILRSFCEFDPALVLKLDLVGKIVELSIELQFEELKTASGESDDFDDDDDHPQDLGALLLNGAAEFFDEALVFEPAMDYATRLLQNANEHKRKGGYHVLAVLADGVQLYMKDRIRQLVTFACAGMRDQSPLVRRFATRTMSRLSYLLAPEVNKHHDLIIPAFFEVLDRPNEKDVIIENACSTLEVFCSNMEDEVVPYLKSLMSKLGLMFQTDNDTVRGSALAAISSVAIAAKSAFDPYFETTVKVLMQILQNQDEDKEELRSRAMSCVGSIAKGVGQERFNVVLADFVKIGMSHLETDNPGLREMTFVFFQDIAEVYGEALLKLETFSTLMASVAESISIVANVTFGVGDDDDDEAESKQEMAEFSNGMAQKMGFTVSEQSLAVANGTTSNGTSSNGGMSNHHESFDIESDDDDVVVQLEENERVDFVRNQYIDEKAAAILTVGMLCNHCGQAFMGTWLKDCLEWLSGSESERDLENSTVLKALASTYDEILLAIHKANPSGSHLNRETEKVITDIYEFYIDRIENNLDREDVVEIIDYVSEAIKRFGQTSFVEIYAPLEDVLIKTFRSEIECLSATYSFHGDRERPEVDAGVHSKLHDAALDVVLGLAKARGDKFGPSLQKFLPVIVKYNQSSQSPKIKSAVIAFFASLVESIPNLLVPLLKDIIDLACLLIPSKESILNQNAAFCLGCVFEHVEPQHTEQHVLRVLKTLKPLINGPIPDGADAAILGARDNAVSAVAKIMLAFKGAQSLVDDGLIEVLLTNVPLRQDMEENKYVYDALFYLWQAHSDKMMPHAGRQLTVFAVALAQDALQQDIKEKIAEFVRRLVASSPQVKQVADTLPVAHQQSLRRCFQ